MTRTRLDYIDTLKFMAIFAVIAIHVFTFWPNAEVMHLSIGKGRQFFRWGVPVFLMISGALLLNRDIDLIDFFKRRFIRIFYPLIFFIVLRYLLQGHVNVLTAFWYCWMIVGAYLAIPILNRFVQSAEEKEIFYYVLIFFIASFIYQATNTFNISYALDINFFITPVSYLMLGYYLSVKKFKYSPNTMIIISIIVFVVTTIIKLKIGNFMEPYGSGVFSSRLDLSLVQIFQACSVFVMVKQLYEKDVTSIFLAIQNFLTRNTCKKFILTISRASYGMFLSHRMLLNFIFPLTFGTLKLTGTQVCLSIAGLTIIMFIMSWLVIYIMSKIPILKAFSGYA